MFTGWKNKHTTVTNIVVGRAKELLIGKICCYLLYTITPSTHTHTHGIDFYIEFLGHQ